MKFAVCVGGGGLEWLTSDLFNVFLFLHMCMILIKGVLCLNKLNKQTDLKRQHNLIMFYFVYILRYFLINMVNTKILTMDFFPRIT